MWLRFKIFIGYTVLIVILVLIVSLLRDEQIKRSNLQVEERSIMQSKALTDCIYSGLLELTTLGEAVCIWNEEDFTEYQNKKREVVKDMQSLKIYINTEQSRIDSLCSLLEKKEEVLDTVMKAFQHLQKVGKIVNKKIPIIVSYIHKDSVKSAKSEENASKSTSTSFWGKLFKRKEKKSAYMVLKSKTGKNIEKDKNISLATNMLHSLKKEITDIQESEEKSLLLQMEELYHNNIILNQKLHSIFKELEKEMNFRTEERYQLFLEESNRSLCHIYVLVISVSLLTIILYVIIHRDLKRKYRYQKELEASDRKNRELLQSKKDMMLAIAHDLRSPLTTITGSADLLPGEKDGRRKAKYVENIRHASEYMLSLVDTLMDFYLLDTGQAQSYERIFHLESLFKETVDNYAPLAQRKSLLLSSGFSGTDVVVCGDKGHLQQIVNNLLSNALKFTKEGSVRLEAEYRRGELRLCVRDTGSGMDEKEAERIFTAFERLENARGVSGFGLGLAICSRLVSRMGGSIRVESRKGQGSEFIVLLPLPPADGKSPLDTERVSRHLRMDGTRVLVLDDDLRQLGIVREMLRRHRAQCDCCGDSSELVSKLRENRYDVLLMDIQMPEMDGFAVLELLRRSNIPQARAIPVIALTARMDDEREYLSHGFAGCIRKPFAAETLLEGMEKVLTPGKEEAGRQPDFSLILQGEDKPDEMLGIFISESRKELSRLHAALEGGDRKAVHDILHKNLPLWESLRLDYPLETLRQTATADPALWTETDMERIREIEKAAGRLLRHAMNLQKKKE